MTKPYNEEQIARITRYAKERDIVEFKLDAYVATTEVVDNEGYTKAHNADVSSVRVSPDNLGLGITSLLGAYKNTDVTISSLAKQGKAKTKVHIPMLDFIVPAVASPLQAPDERVGGLFMDVSQFLIRTVGDDLIGPPTIYVSGNSYHAYSLLRDPVSVDLFKNLIGAFLVCDHNKVADHAWLGFALARGEFRLRLTAVQDKYRMVPTLPKDLLAAATAEKTNTLPDECPF